MSVNEQELQAARRSGLMTAPWLPKLRAYVALMKPRIMVMLVFTSLCAAFVAARGIPDIGRTFWMLIGMSLSAGGAAAVNMWYDRDIDVVMKRTSKRPLPMGIVRPQEALAFGLVLGALSFLLLAVFVNLLTAVLSALGFVYYAVVYTMWLKRRTPHNTVIGGGAGAVPPLIGWAAVTGQVTLASILMFAVIFLWTPPHFWALALYKNDEYTRAGVPMMPVVRGPRHTKRLSVFYAVLLAIGSAGLYFTGVVDRLYLIGALAVEAVFVYFTVRMWLERDDRFVWAKRTFFCSLAVLPVVFIIMVFGMA